MRCCTPSTTRRRMASLCSVILYYNYTRTHAHTHISCVPSHTPKYACHSADPDFYGEMVPEVPPCPPCCEKARDKVATGLAGIWSWTQVYRMCSLITVI
jgi:hypothetical protein